MLALGRYVGYLEEEYRTVGDILTFERNTTNEITMLTELLVYPSAELALIRKDLKALNDQKQVAIGNANNRERLLDELLAEMKLSEKKNIILNNRRVEEEESRALAERKAMKQRKKEEGQSRDPMNFANHSGRR